MRKRTTYTTILLFLLAGIVYSQKSVSILPDAGCDSMYADFIFTYSPAGEGDYTYLFEAAYYKAGEGELVQYEWRFPDGTIVVDSTASYTFPEEGYYDIFLLLSNDLGCSDSISRKIPIFMELKPPNVFTPNGDMINDYFEVTTQGDFLYTFRVFTRTGTQVHYSQTSKIVWDGRTVGGREVPEGVYYYVIESNETPLETRLSGFIHLYR